MTPAVEYLVRSGIIKDLLRFPCALSLQNSSSNRVVTIKETKDRFLVKHWDVNSCSESEILPPVKEFKVTKQQLFSDPAVIVPDYQLINYQEDPIPSLYNSPKGPMSSELYSYFYENALTSLRHNNKKLNWLWNNFIQIHATNLASTQRIYSNTDFGFMGDIAEEQRVFVSQNMKKQWNCWQVWCRYMLLTPGELYFQKEYLKPTSSYSYNLSSCN